MTCRVMFVDDDADVRAAIGQSLELAGHDVTLCRAFIEATDHLTPGFAGVVVTDIRMPGKDGFALLERAAKIDPELPVIMLTGEGDIPMTVRAMNAGAHDFLEKPCPPKRLLEAIDRAWAKRAAVLEERRRRAEQLAVSEARGERAGAGLAAQMDYVEKLLIEGALADHGGRVAAAADALGLPRKTAYDKLKRHGIDPADFRSD
ncbi:response regulator [Algicella marina]|uniref:Response regulator n=1 Tax=Algicella marina TaxID=2683284 RepID=A0A6P1T027_9RHOB|nr:response regulator [Algicella marina]